MGIDVSIEPQRTDRVFNVGDLKVVETEYYYRFIDWHEHPKPYLSFVTAGFCRETSRKKVFDCAPNTLLFHNAGDAHSNVKAGKVSRGLSIELEPEWFAKFDLDLDALPSVVQISHPEVTVLTYNIYKEARIAGPGSGISIDSLLLDIFGKLPPRQAGPPSHKPAWVGRLEALLHSKGADDLNLLDISSEIGVHWAHLSREFPRYFKCNFSEYLRKLRIERSLGLLRKKSVPLADIAAICGFSDQSHFTRCFRMYLGTTPGDFRKIAFV